MRADEEQRLDEPSESTEQDAAPTDGGEAAESETQAAEPGTEVQEISPERALAVTGDRLTDVLLAADQAAEEILDAARAEAREFVDETQQATVERAESLRRETDNLLAQTTELTSKVTELARATELVMESFRAELSLDAAEVREEVVEMGPAHDAEPAAELAAGPADPPVPSEDPARSNVGTLNDSPGDVPADGPTEPEADTSTPVPETISFEAATPPVAPESVAADAERDSDDSEEIASEDASPEPAQTTAAGPPAQSDRDPEPPAPKRRGLFGRLRRRQASGEITTPQQASVEPDPAPSGPAAPVTEGAKLIARQMLATGLPEDEVRRQLREQFRLADPQAVLDSLGRDQSRNQR